MKKKYNIIYKISETNGNNMDVTHQLEMGLSPRMHQTSNNRYNANSYGSLRVTPVGCGLKTPNRHGKKHSFFIHLHPSYSSISNYQQHRFAINTVDF